MKKPLETKFEDFDTNKNIIATITHDLKTPAMAQIKALELLLKGSFGEINESQRSFIKDILNSCNNMLDMLVNMLWLYKFDNHKLALNIVSFNINELINDIFKENKLMISSKNQKFELQLDNVFTNVMADKMHIKRIITNLIMNAITHSKEKTTIYISTFALEDELVLQVKNRGNVIPNDLLTCIFDKNKIFTQKCDGLSTGLGLYLSNSLLELNSGKMSYNFESDGLNVFQIALKLHKSSL